MNTQSQNIALLSRIAVYIDVCSQDCYTVVYLDFPEKRRGFYAARAMDVMPCDPGGFSQFTTAMLGDHLGLKINFSALPTDCQRVVLSDLESFKR